jgi:hypothetical protein
MTHMAVGEKLHRVRKLHGGERKGKGKKQGRGRRPLAERCEAVVAKQELRVMSAAKEHPLWTATGVGVKEKEEWLLFRPACEDPG